jgi:hypothetical protein
MATKTWCFLAVKLYCFVNYVVWHTIVHCMYASILSSLWNENKGRVRNLRAICISQPQLSRLSSRHFAQPQPATIAVAGAIECFSQPPVLISQPWPTAESTLISDSLSDRCLWSTRLNGRRWRVVQGEGRACSRTQNGGLGHWPRGPVHCRRV